MLKEEINEVRNKLNNMIENGESEESIYKVSEELDKLIVKYYDAKKDTNECNN